MLMRLVFNLKERLAHPRLRSCLKTAASNEFLRSIGLQARVDAKMQALLEYAVAHVPYYRKLAEARGKKSLCLSDFPIITKADIRGHESEFVSDKYELSKLEKTCTSGSTGEPFVFYRDPIEWDASYAVLWRGLMRFGIRPGDKRVLVKGVDETASVSFETRVRRAIYGWLNRCIVIDAHFLAKSEANVLAEIRRMVSYRPDFLHGYASSIYLLARTAEEHCIDMTGLRVKAVVTESEKCHSFQRELMERVFNAPVVENYGCVEFGMIAQPAKDGMLCINEDHVCVETDEDGNAILTNLDARAFPLIRFKNGDRLEVGSGHSQLPYRTIQKIDGRVAETIHLPQGGSLQGYIVMYPISKHMAVLHSYQVYQPDVEHLKIRLVPSEVEVPSEIQAQMIREMREITGPRIDIGVEIVQSIPLTKRGKRTFVISDVQ